MAQEPVFAIPAFAVDERTLAPLDPGDYVGGAFGMRRATAEWGVLTAIAVTNACPWPNLNPLTANIDGNSPVFVVPDATLDAGADAGSAAGSSVGGGDENRPVSSEEAFAAAAAEYGYWAAIAADVMHTAATATPAQLRALGVAPGALRVNPRRKLAGMIVQAAINGVEGADMFDVKDVGRGLDAVKTQTRRLLKAVVRRAAGGDAGVAAAWARFRTEHNFVSGGTGAVDWSDAARCVAAAVAVAELGPSAVGRAAPAAGYSAPRLDLGDGRPPTAAEMTAFKDAVEDVVRPVALGPHTMPFRVSREGVRTDFAPDPAPPLGEDATDWLRDVAAQFAGIGVELPINTDPMYTPEAPSTGLRCVLVHAAKPVRDVPAGSCTADLAVVNIRGWVTRAVADMTMGPVTPRPRAFFAANDAAVMLYVVSPQVGVCVYATDAGTCDAQTVKRGVDVETTPRGAPYAVGDPCIRWRHGVGVSKPGDPMHTSPVVDVDPAAFVGNDELTRKWVRGATEFCLQMLGQFGKADVGPTGRRGVYTLEGTALTGMTDLYALESDDGVAERRRRMTAALSAMRFDCRVNGCLLPVAWSRDGPPDAKLDHPHTLVNDVIAGAGAGCGLHAAGAQYRVPVQPSFDQVDNTLSAALQRVFLATHGYSPAWKKHTPVTFAPDVVAAASMMGHTLGPVPWVATCATQGGRDEGALGVPDAIRRPPTVGSMFGPRPFLPPELAHVPIGANPAAAATGRYFEFCRATADAAFRYVGTAAAAGIASYPFRDHADAVTDMVTNIVVDAARPAWAWLPVMLKGPVSYNDPSKPVAHDPATGLPAPNATLSVEEAEDVLFNAVALAGANLIGAGVAAASEPIRGREGVRGESAVGGNTRMWTANAFGAAAVELIRAALRPPREQPIDAPAGRTPADDSDSDSDGDDVLGGGAEEAGERLYPPPPVTENDPDTPAAADTLRLTTLVLFNNYLGRKAFQDAAKTHTRGTNLPREAAMYAARALGSRLMAFDTEVVQEAGAAPSMDDLEDTRGVIAFLVNAALCRKPKSNDSGASTLVASLVRGALTSVRHHGRGFVVPSDASPRDVAKLQAVYDAWVGPRFDAKAYRTPPRGYLDRQTPDWRRTLADDILKAVPGSDASTNAETVAEAWARHVHTVYQAYTQEAIDGAHGEEARQEAVAVQAAAGAVGGAGPSLSTLQSVVTYALFPSVNPPMRYGGVPVPAPTVGSYMQPVWRPIRFVALSPLGAFACHIDENDMVMRHVTSGVEHRFSIVPVPAAPGHTGEPDDDEVEPHLPHPAAAARPAAATDAELADNWRAYVAVAAAQAVPRATGMVASATAVLNSIAAAWSAADMRIHTVLFDPNHVLGAASGAQWALIHPTAARDAGPDQVSGWAHRVKVWGKYYARLLLDPVADTHRNHASLDADYFTWTRDDGTAVDADDVYAFVRGREVQPVPGGPAPGDEDLEDEDLEDAARWQSRLTAPARRAPFPVDREHIPSVEFGVRRSAGPTPRGSNFTMSALYIHPFLRGLEGVPTPDIVAAQREIAVAEAAAGGRHVPEALEADSNDVAAAVYVAEAHRVATVEKHGVTALEMSVLGILRQAVTAVLDGDPEAGPHQTTAPQDVIDRMHTDDEKTMRPIEHTAPVADGLSLAQGTAIEATVAMALPDSRAVLDNSMLAVAALHAGIYDAMQTTLRFAMAPRDPPPNVDLLATYAAVADYDAITAALAPARRILAIDPVHDPDAPDARAAVAAVAGIRDLAGRLPVHPPGAQPDDGADTQEALTDIMVATTEKGAMFSPHAYTICGNIDTDEGRVAPHYMSAMDVVGSAVAVVHLNASPFPGFDPAAAAALSATSAARAKPRPGQPPSPVRVALGQLKTAAASLATAAGGSDTDVRLVNTLRGVFIGALHALAATSGKPPHALQAAALVRSASSTVTVSMHTAGFSVAVRPDPMYAHVASYNTPWVDSAPLHVDVSDDAAFHGVFASVTHKRFNIRSFCAVQRLPWSAAVRFGVGPDADAMAAVYRRYLTPIGNDPTVFPQLPRRWDGGVRGFDARVYVDPVADSPAGRFAKWGATVGLVGVAPPPGRSLRVHEAAGDETLATIGLLAAYALHTQPYRGASVLATALTTELRPPLFLGTDAPAPLRWALDPDPASRDAPAWCVALRREARRAGIRDPLHAAAFVMSQFIAAFAWAPGIKDAFGRLPATSVTLDGVGTGDGAEPVYTLFPLATLVPAATLVMPPAAELPSTIADLASYVYSLVGALPRDQRTAVRNTLALIASLALFKCPRVGVSAAPYIAITPTMGGAALRAARIATFHRIRTLFARPAKTLVEASWAVVAPAAFSAPGGGAPVVAAVAATAVNRKARIYTVLEAPRAGCEPRLAITSVSVYNADAGVDEDAQDPEGIRALPAGATAQWSRTRLPGNKRAGAALAANPASTAVVLQPGYVYQCTVRLMGASAAMPPLTAIGTLPRDAVGVDPTPPFEVPVVTFS